MRLELKLGRSDRPEQSIDNAPIGFEPPDYYLPDARVWLRSRKQLHTTTHIGVDHEAKGGCCLYQPLSIASGNPEAPDEAEYLLEGSRFAYRDRCLLTLYRKPFERELDRRRDRVADLHFDEAVGDVHRLHGVIKEFEGYKLDDAVVGAMSKDMSFIHLAVFYDKGPSLDHLLAFWSVGENVRLLTNLPYYWCR